MYRPPGSMWIEWGSETVLATVPIGAATLENHRAVSFTPEHKQTLGRDSSR